MVYTVQPPPKRRIPWIPTASAIDYVLSEIWKSFQTVWGLGRATWSFFVTGTIFAATNAKCPLGWPLAESAVAAGGGDNLWLLQCKSSVYLIVAQYDYCMKYVKMSYIWNFEISIWLHLHCLHLSVDSTNDTSVYLPCRERPTLLSGTEEVAHSTGRCCTPWAELPGVLPQRLGWIQSWQKSWTKGCFSAGSV